MRFRKACTTVAVTLGLTIATAARAANLVENGDFETGNLSGWELSGNRGYTGLTNSDPIAGNFSATLGPVGSLGHLAQHVATRAGVSYTISFRLSNEWGGMNSFEAFFDGVSLLALSAAEPFAARRYQFVRSAASNNAELRFSYRHDPSFWYLDDIAVAPADAVPEPGSWALMFAGFGLAGYALRRRRVRTMPCFGTVLA